MPRPLAWAAAIWLGLCQAAPAAPLTLAELMTAMATVDQRRASFTEEKRLAALSEPLRSTGRLHYRRPGHLEKLTDAPLPESLVVDGDRLAIDRPNQAPLLIDLASQPELRVLVDGLRAPLAGDLPALQRGFAVDIQGSLAAWRLDLTPRDPAMAALLRGLRLSGTFTDLREALTVQANGDTTYLSIEPAP